MAAHPRVGGFGLMPLQQHLLSCWASEGAELLCGDAALPWVAVGRVLWGRWAALRPLGADASSAWGLLLCDRACLFGDEAWAVPRPLREMAQGLRALPPPQHVGDEPLRVSDLC